MVPVMVVVPGPADEGVTLVIVGVCVEAYVYGTSPRLAATTLLVHTCAT